MVAGLRLGDLKRYLALPIAAQLGWAEAFAALLAVRCGLKALPLERLATGLGVQVCRGTAKSSYCETAEVVVIAARVRALLARWPSRSPCLVSALAAGFLLREHEPALFIGVRQGVSGVVAHAWLDVRDGRVPLNVPDDALDFVLLRRSNLA